MDYHWRKQDCGQDFKNQEISSLNTFFLLLRLLQTQTGLCGIETLLFLPPESRAALYALGNYVDTKMSQLKHGAEVETEKFGQAQYINWCMLKSIPDPCGSERGYERTVAWFAKNLIIVDCNSQSTTIQGYARSINKLFELRDLPIPANILYVWPQFTTGSLKIENHSELPVRLLLGMLKK